jgi:cytochrome c556
MKELSKRLLLAGVSMTVLAGAAIPALAADADVIKYRQAVMKAMGGHMGGTAAIVKGKVDYSDHIVGQARALRNTAKMVAVAFAKRTEGGKTRAKAEIWNDTDGFKSKVADLEKATQALMEAAESGGVQGASAKLDAVGKACGGCHKKYREKKS